MVDSLCVGLSHFSRLDSDGNYSRDNHRSDSWCKAYTQSSDVDCVEIG